MELFLYLLLAVVLYGMLADYIDRAVEREMERRRHRVAHLYLVENHDAGAADAAGRAGGSTPRSVAKIWSDLTAM